MPKENKNRHFTWGLQNIPKENKTPHFAWGLQNIPKENKTLILLEAY